jgi:hypothetical protein
MRIRDGDMHTAHESFPKKKGENAQYSPPRDYIPTRNRAKERTNPVITRLKSDSSVAEFDQNPTNPQPHKRGTPKSAFTDDLTPDEAGPSPRHPKNQPRSILEAERIEPAPSARDPGGQTN